MGNIITGVMRKAVKDVEIKGYLIPKGWCVLVYFRSVHVDEEHFESPYHFNPWRWQVSIESPNYLGLVCFFFSFFFFFFVFFNG